MSFMEQISAKLKHDRISYYSLSNDSKVSTLSIPTPQISYPDELISFAVSQYEQQRLLRADAVRAVAGELIANAINHGNENDSEKMIRVHCLWRKCFYLSITDEGPGLDINNPPFVPGRSGIPPEGGLGLAYSKQLSDALYNDGSTVISIFRT